MNVDVIFNFKLQEFANRVDSKEYVELEQILQMNDYNVLKSVEQYCRIKKIPLTDVWH